MSKFDGKNVLITGATGLIGSHIVDKLMAETSANVIAMSRNEKKLKEGFAKYVDSNRFSIKAMDVSIPFEDFGYGIDYIFHAAGPMEGKIIANYPVDVINPNLIGTINCLKFIIENREKYNKNARLIMFSSVTVYGNNTTEDVTVSETDTNVTEKLENVSAPYSQSKRMSEVIARAYAKQYDVDVVIARFSTVYGNTVFRPDTAFFQFIDNGLKKENVCMNVSGIGRRDNIYIDDAVEGIMCIALNGEKGEAYNVSSNGDKGNYVAVDEVAMQILNDLNNRFNLENEKRLTVLYKDGGKNKRKPGLKLNNEKLKALGWDVKYSLEEGIRKTLDLIILENSME